MNRSVYFTLTALLMAVAPTIAQDTGGLPETVQSGMQ